ncbi:MobA/MobL family protein [Xanthomonas axonopodis pv. khayae]|uniref:MobA/MobL family protein n=1 Tax=Xanthomonas axonopodis TaxID=53413 RepID=UPI002117B83F|nr:MobA/MobL family protein [Xanthomonas axonopodis]
MDLDDPSGTRHNYSRKAGVLSVDMLAPTDAPAWALDPHQVWSKVEEHETRKNARVAREVLIALPHELTPEQRRDLARDVGQLLVDRYGVAAQVALHAPDKGGDNRNYHAHILMTPRVVGADGFGDSAARVLDEYVAGANELKAIRAAIGERMNKALASAGVDARVDHRSLHKQKMAAVEKGDFKAAVALDRPATRHEGKEVTQARRRGTRLQKAERNDRVRDASASRVTAHAERFEALKAQAAAEGRLAHVDEQALHAQALLERRKESAVRLRAAQPSPTEAPRHDPISPSRQPGRKRRPRAPALTRNNIDACRVRKPGTGNERMPALRPLHNLNPGLASGGRPAAEGAGFSRVLRPDEQRHRRAGPAVLQLPAHAVAAKPGAAVQARAQRPAAHKAGASMPRPAPVGGGQQGKGAAGIERASRKTTPNRQAELMAGEQVAKSLDEMIERMFKVARRALQSSNATPEQRSVSRTLLQRRDDLAEKRQAHMDAKQAREDARLARRRAVADANTFPVPTDLRSTLLRKVGRPTAKDRAAQAMQEQRQQARIQEQQARALREQTKEATDKAGVAFELATADFLTQFPHQFPPAQKHTVATEELQPGLEARIKSPFIDAPMPAVQPRPPGPGRR